MGSSSKVILAIDTSTRYAGVALYDGVKVIFERSWISVDHHTVELAPAVEVSLSQTGLEVSNLGAVAVALGPGSFTGLRIGLAMAKGLSIARHLPLVGIPSLDVTAYSIPIRDMPLVTVLQAGRRRLAAGWYKKKRGKWESTGEVEGFTPEELISRIQSTTLLCGELTEEERQLFARQRKTIKLSSPAHSLRRPAFLAELAWIRFIKGDIDDAASLAPIYLHYNEPIPE